MSTLLWAATCIGYPPQNAPAPNAQPFCQILFQSQLQLTHALQAAAFNNVDEIRHMKVIEGREVDGADMNGRTPLMIACKYGQLPAVQVRPHNLMLLKFDKSLLQMILARRTTLHAFFAPWSALRDD